MMKRVMSLVSLVAVAGLGCEPEQPPPPDLTPDLQKEAQERRAMDEDLVKRIADEKAQREKSDVALAKQASECSVTCRDPKAACCRCITTGTEAECKCHDTAPSDCASGGDGASQCSINCPTE